MNWLFKENINGKESWEKLFQSTNAFTQLINEIYTRHNLKLEKIQNLTPGTNAVFRMGDKVIKIFAPIESGFSTGDDYFIELSALKHANNKNVLSPLLICADNICDKYFFRYIIMDYIEGKEAEHKLPLYSKEQRYDFAYKLKEITQKLNIKYEQKEIPIFNINNCIENKSWDEFSKSFCEDRINHIKKNEFSNFIYNHGDLTGENIIIDNKDNIYIIDFADSKIAPYYYEWVVIVFGLFKCDLTMMEIYFDNFKTDDFYNILTLSAIIHEFGAGIVKNICEMSNISKDTINNINNLKELLKNIIEKNKIKLK